MVTFPGEDTVPRVYLTVLLSCCALLLAGCTGIRSESRAADATGDELNGPALYEKHCARCHRPLEKTTKPQRSASRLRSANRQFPAMNYLDFLTDAQLEAIAAALGTLPGNPQQSGTRR